MKFLRELLIEFRVKNHAPFLLVDRGNKQLHQLMIKVDSGQVWIVGLADLVIRMQ